MIAIVGVFYILIMCCRGKTDLFFKSQELMKQTVDLTISNKINIFLRLLFQLVSGARILRGWNLWTRVFRRKWVHSVLRGMPPRLVAMSWKSLLFFVKVVNVVSQVPPIELQLEQTIKLLLPKVPTLAHYAGVTSVDSLKGASREKTEEMEVAMLTYLYFGQNARYVPMDMLRSPLKRKNHGASKVLCLLLDRT